MSTYCPACKKNYRLPADGVGREFVCKRCGRKLAITAAGLALVAEEGSAERRPPSRPPKPIPPPPEGDPDDEVPIRRPRPSPVADYLLFRRGPSERGIVRSYWLMTAACVASGAFTVYHSFRVPSVSLSGLGGALGGDLLGGGGGGLPLPTVEHGFSIWLFLLGVAQIVVVPALLRTACGFVLTVVRIHARLTEIRDLLEATPVAEFSPPAAAASPAARPSPRPSPSSSA